MVRNTESFGSQPGDMPVYGTVASRFNDDGVTALYQELSTRLVEHGLVLPAGGGALARVDTKVSSADTAIVPPAKVRYLAEVAEAVRGYHARTSVLAEAARERQAVRTTRALVAAAGGDEEAAGLPALEAAAASRIDAPAQALLDEWPATVAAYSGDEHTVTIRGRDITTQLTKESLSGTKVPRVALPRTTDEGDLLIP